MNGFRKGLSEDVDELRQLVEKVVKGDFFDEEELVDAMNKVVTSSNVINCVFVEGDKNFTDLSDLEIEHIEIEDEELQKLP